jgi:hypothetical protein
LKRSANVRHTHITTFEQTTPPPGTASLGIARLASARIEALQSRFKNVRSSGHQADKVVVAKLNESPPHRICSDVQSEHTILMYGDYRHG